MAAVFMSHPTTVLLQYLSKEGTPRGKTEFRLGRLSMALEILTQMKILDSLPMTDLSIQLGSAFQALLVDTMMMDEAERWYEKLDAWRAPRFSADRSRDRAFGASSIAASPEGSLPRTRRLRSSLLGRRGQDERTKPESEESSASEEGTTST